ncbi:hypothetical protein B0H12DRAFT_713257 [Mycena haematopus]|nr:hypothetical protein B0H12DRAFT_713257 [Mycena haematopus]
MLKSISPPRPKSRLFDGQQALKPATFRTCFGRGNWAAKVPGIWEAPCEIPNCRSPQRLAFDFNARPGSRSAPRNVIQHICIILSAFSRITDVR